MFTSRFFTVFVVLVLVTLLAFAPQATAFAGESVNPATLNPPPPPQFNPTCKAIGAGTICDLAFTDPPIAEGTGIFCGSGANSFEVFFTGTRSVEGKRYYDRDGNLTQRHFRETIVGTFTNPLTGATVSSTQRDTVIHNLAVPGDVNTGTETITGSQQLHLLNGGIVLVDAGRTVLAADGTLLSESGLHPFSAYYESGDSSAVQAICDALE
jgi:hypothetical protein